MAILGYPEPCKARRFDGGVTGLTGAECDTPEDTWALIQSLDPRRKLQKDIENSSFRKMIYIHGGFSTCFMKIVHKSFLIM
jgi:hypothetical protein